MSDETPVAQTVAPASHPRGKKMTWAFGVALALCLCAAAFLFSRIPAGHELIAVPSALIVFALMLLLMLWETVVERRVAKRIAGWSSCGIWVSGIACSFIMKPTSTYIFLPDMILLAGFFPLLYYWSFSWTWLIFGFFNGGIGLLLRMVSFMPDNLFPHDLLLPKHHLSEYHPSMSWILFGLVAIVYGLIRWIKNMYKLATGLVRKSADGEKM